MSVVVLAMFDVCAVSRPNCGHARLPTSILASLLRYRLVFPGVVPRSFVGSLVLAAAVWPPMQLGLHFGYLTSKLQLQLLC